MAEFAITSFLQEVKEIKKSHTKLISGSGNDFKKLSRDLLLLNSFFQNASEHSEMNEMLRSETDRRIRDVVFDIEDAIEDCLLNAEAKSTMSVFRRHLDLNRFSVAKKVRRLRKKKLIPMIDKVKRDFQHIASFSYPVVARSIEEPASRLGKSKSIWQEEFVGFKDEKDALLSKLVEQTKELGVIAIYGIDGSGKTTLAKKIFEDEKIWLEFPTRIWISASKRFNSRDVLLNILKRFIGDDMSNSSDHDLARAVHMCLAEEKFLLVIDDLRSRDVWTAVTKALPHSNVLGKVLITTQDLSMAKYASVGPHMLRSLTDKESLELLGNIEGCSLELIDGEKIAKACRGLPLAVVVIGGNIVNMFMKNAWGGDMTAESKLQELVEWSYDRLSYYLKACFLYLAVFSEDQHIIPTRTLTQLWIGEGFIPPKKGRMLEETAEEFLDELIRRKLVMVDSVNPLGEVKTCRLHNVIREFARSKALEHHFFQEITTPNQRVLEESTRLCLHSDLTKFLSVKPKLGARSLYCFHREPAHLDPELVSTISDAFKSLRVLDSKYTKFTEFPAWLTKLIHLRYVTLSVAALTVVPETLSQLFNLQTLVVETKSRSITMKANIWRMYRLRHLHTKAAIILDTKFEGKAESLQTVGRLSPESCTNISERASNLKKLAIRGKLAIFFKNMSFLQELNRLEKLELVNDDPSPSDMAPLNDLPPLTHFPRTLRQLTLSNTFLKWEHMSKLADIKTLEVLKLKDNAFTGIHWSAVNYRFPKLQFLLIANTDLVHWEASDDSFPELSCLVIKMCENLNEIPEAVFKELTKLDIERVGKYAVQSARKIAKSKASMGFKLSVC